jgi:hypothetical protein
MRWQYPKSPLHKRGEGTWFGHGIATNGRVLLGLKEGVIV